MINNLVVFFFFNILFIYFLMTQTSIAYDENIKKNSPSHYNNIQTWLLVFIFASEYLYLLQSKCIQVQICTSGFQKNNMQAMKDLIYMEFWPDSKNNHHQKLFSVCFFFLLLFLQWFIFLYFTCLFFSPQVIIFLVLSAIVIDV